MRRGHRAARLRPAGSAQRVQARGVPALRRAARPHPPRRRVLDLPGHRHPPAAPSPAAATRRWPPRSPGERPSLRGGDGSNGQRLGRVGRAVGAAGAARRGDASPAAGRGGAAIPAAAAVGGSAILRGGPAAPPTARPMRESLGDQPVGSAGGGRCRRPSGPKPGFTPSGARIGRNDPCWCGSGAKYKKCHGR